MPSPLPTKFQRTDPTPALVSSRTVPGSKVPPRSVVPKTLPLASFDKTVDRLLTIRANAKAPQHGLVPLRGQLKDRARTVSSAELGRAVEIAVRI